MQKWPEPMLVLTATSSNQAMVTNANIVLGGSGNKPHHQPERHRNANSTTNGGTATIRCRFHDGAAPPAHVHGDRVAVNDGPHPGRAPPMRAWPKMATCAECASARRSAKRRRQRCAAAVTLVVTNGMLSLGRPPAWPSSAAPETTMPA